MPRSTPRSTPRSRPLDARLEGKLRFWELADPATDVLHGIEHDLPAVRDEGLQLLKTLLTPARRSDGSRPL